MVKIYTRKGDDGTTSLWYGGRVPKHHRRTEAYGALDEASSQLGVARSLCGPDRAELAADILRLQDDIFIAGAELATAPEAAERLEDGISRTNEEMVAEVEERIDRYMAEVELPPQFVIPGGNQLSAQLDVARTTIRRAERRISELNAAGELASETVVHFVNRASDLAFAMARYADVADPVLFEGRRRSQMKVLARRAADAEGGLGYAHDVEIEGGHTVRVDEPLAAGGADSGPSPTRLVAAALAGCVAVTMEMYADRKGWDVGAVEVEVDVEHAEHTPRSFAVTLRLPPELSDEQRQRLLRVAAKCPVHKLLAGETQVSVRDRIEALGGAGDGKGLSAGDGGDL